MRAIIVGLLLSLSLALLNWLTLVLIINPGRNIKSDSKLCHCITTDNFAVLITRNKDGKIEILRDSEGNYIVAAGGKFKNIKKIGNVQSVIAKITPDGRLSLPK